MRRHQVVTAAPVLPLVLLSLVLLGPLRVEAAGTVTGVSASPSTPKVGQYIKINIQGTGGPCTLKVDVSGDWSWMGVAPPSPWNPMLPATPGTTSSIPASGRFLSAGTSTITVTNLSTSCQVQGAGNVVTTSVTIEPAKVSIVDWKAVPEKYEGPCPATINFSGKVLVNYAPAKVSYTFSRSDGASALTYYGQAQTGWILVERSWKLGGPNLPNPSGWMALMVATPSQVESPKANFAVRCVSPGVSPKKPDTLKPKIKVGPPPVEKK